MKLTTDAPTVPIDLPDPVGHKKASKLHDAAQQFEALMLGELLKSVRDSSSGGWLGSGDSTGNDSAMDMAQNQLANVLARSGGLGLSQVIEQRMTRPGDHQNENAVDAKLSAGSLK